MGRAARENQILVIIKNPGEEPRVEPLFDNTLKAFQQAVGGSIEVCTLFKDAALICNEEGRLLGLPDNAEICGCPFVGPVVLAGVRGSEFASLKASDLLRLLRMMGGR